MLRTLNRFTDSFVWTILLTTTCFITTSDANAAGSFSFQVAKPSAPQDDESDDSQIAKIEAEFQKAFDTAHEFKFREAATMLRTVVKKAEQHFPKNDSRLVEYHDFIGQVLLQTGEAGEAIGHLSRAMEIADEIPDYPIADKTTPICSLAKAFILIADFGNAINVTKTHIKLIEKEAPHEKLSLASTLHQLGTTYMSSARYPESIEAFERAFRLYKEAEHQSGDEYEEFLRNYSASASETGNHDLALTLIDRAIVTYQTRVGIEVAKKAFLCSYLAEKASILRLASRYDESNKLCEKIIELQTNAFNPNPHLLMRANINLAGNHWYSGRHKTMGPLNESLKYIRMDFLRQASSLDQRQLYLASIPLRNQLNLFHQLLVPTSYEMVENAFDQTTCLKGCSFRILANRARAKMDQETILPEPGDIRKRLAANLDNDTVVVEIHQAKETYYAWVVTKDDDGLNIGHLKFGDIESIDYCIDEFVASIRHNPNAIKNVAARDPDVRGVESILPAFKTPKTSWGKKLVNKIWGPVATHVGDRTNIVICGDGKLALFPWSALPSTKPGSYLVQDFRISMESDLMVVNEILEQTQAPIHRLVGVAGIKYSAKPKPADAKTRFPHLPGSEVEIKLVEKAFQKSGKETELLGAKDINESALKNAFNQGTVLHLATHGTYLGDFESVSRPANWYRAEHLGGNPLKRSVLALSGINDMAPDAKESGDGWLSAHEVVQWNLKSVPLVVLSSCEGAIGEIRTQEGVYGVQRAFRRAGAQTTIVSLWSVSDKNAPVFFDHFYDHLLKGEGKAEALRKAKLDMIKKGVPARHWAGWVLSGDWR